MRHGHLVTVELGETADDLTSVGFAMPFRIGHTEIRPARSDEATGTGVGALSVVGVETLDGLPLRPPPPGALVDEAPEHPNGVVAIDHVVVATPNPDRTHAAFEAAGLAARRVRSFDAAQGRQRQTFFWMGDVICEVVGPDEGAGDGPASVWGLALTVRDIDSTHRSLAPLVSDVKPALQPHRRVCTLKAPCIETPILFISPHPPMTTEALDE